jgi:hypothetical protein
MTAKGVEFAGELRFPVGREDTPEYDYSYSYGGRDGLGGRGREGRGDEAKRGRSLARSLTRGPGRSDSYPTHPLGHTPPFFISRNCQGRSRRLCGTEILNHLRGTVRISVGRALRKHGRCRSNCGNQRAELVLLILKGGCDAFPD